MNSMLDRKRFHSRLMAVHYVYTGVHQRAMKETEAPRLQLTSPLQGEMPQPLAFMDNLRKCLKLFLCHLVSGAVCINGMKNFISFKCFTYQRTAAVVFGSDFEDFCK